MICKNYVLNFPRLHENKYGETGRFLKFEELKTR